MNTVHIGGVGDPIDIGELGEGIEFQKNEIDKLRTQTIGVEKDPHPINPVCAKSSNTYYDDYLRLEAFLDRREAEIADMAGWGVLMCLPRWSSSRNRLYIEVVSASKTTGYFDVSSAKRIEEMVARETGIDVFVKFARGGICFD